MLLGLYAFTGEDATSAFKGKGNIGQLKKLQTIPKYHAAFQWVSFIVCELIVYTYCKRDSLYFCRQLGDDWSVKSEVINNFEQFTCAMYGLVQCTAMQKNICERGANDNATADNWRWWDIAFKIQSWSFTSSSLQKHFHPAYLPR